MKILFPAGEATKDEIQLLLDFAIEGRKRVKDQLMRIDNTYNDVTFGYIEAENGSPVKIETKEEIEYPQFYFQKPSSLQKNLTSKEADVSGQRRPIIRDIDISKLIQMGESATLEFKSTIRWSIKAQENG